MKKCLILGGKGRVGAELTALLLSNKTYKVLSCDKNQCDITKQEDVAKAVKSFNPHIICNCSAYTAVDKAESTESERFMAYCLNASSLRSFVNLRNKGITQAKFIHISTDHVFAGDKPDPYNENDVCNPVNFYGFTKRAGELVMRDYDGSAIIRTSWVYGRHKPSFVEKILTSIQTDSVSVVKDQMGSPTLALDLALALVKFMEMPWSQIPHQVPLILHFANRGSCSRFDFAKKAVELAKEITQNDIFDVNKLIPTYTTRRDGLALRPTQSALYMGDLSNMCLGITRKWDEALRVHIEHLREAGFFDKVMKHESNDHKTG